MIKVVPDTNVMIRGLLSHKNQQRRIINWALEKKIVLIGSNETVNEFSEKLYKKSITKWCEDMLFPVKKVITSYQLLVRNISLDYCTNKLEVCDDPDDNIFLTIAKYADCKIIVSEDNDLLRLKKVDDIRIVNTEKLNEVLSKRFK